MFKKGRERRQEKRGDRKDKKETKRENRRKNAGIGVAVGAGVVATAAGVNAYNKNKARKEEEEEAASGYESSSSSSSSASSESDFEDGFEIKHLSEYTCLEVQYFLIAIGLEHKCDIFEEKQITGHVLITLDVTQLEGELGCTSFEAKKITGSIEFSFEITEGSNNMDDTTKPTCPPPNRWTEAEVCLVLVAIGMGQKIRTIQDCHVTGAVLVSATSVELQQECGMTSVEVKKFQTVIVKTEKGGCGIEPDIDTSPPPPPEVESSSGPNKTAIGLAVGGAAVVAGGIGYAAWKKKKSNKQQQEEEEEIVQQEESVSSGGGGGGGSSGYKKTTVAAASATAVVVGGGGGKHHKEEEEEDDDEDCEPPSVKHPCDWTKVEVRYFIIAVGMEGKCDMFEEKDVDGTALVKITKQELQVEYGCTSMQIKKFTAAIEFSIEVSEGCNTKPPKQWSESEICLIFLMIGMGAKIKTIKRHHVSGALIMSMTKVELEGLKQDCGMSSVEVKKFKGVAVKHGKTSSGGGSGGGGYKKTTTVAAVSVTAVAVGGHGSSGVDGGGGDCEKPPMEHPRDWSKMEVQYFLIAIGFNKRKCEEFKSEGVTGKVLVKLSKTELESQFGCSSSEIKTFTAALAFSVEVTESEGGCKPPKKWTELDVCLVMISIGLGTKVEKIHKHHITGSVVISMSAVELQKKCSMTDFQVTKFKAVVGVSVSSSSLSGSGGGDRGRSRSRSPSSSRSSSSSSRSSHDSNGSKKKKKKKKDKKKHHSKSRSPSPGHHHGGGGGAVKVTKTTVTKTTVTKTNAKHY